MATDQEAPRSQPSEPALLPDHAPELAENRPATAMSTSFTGTWLLTPQEAAAALAINRTTLYDLLNSGGIRSLKIGRARRIPLGTLKEWIQDQLADESR